MVMNCNHTWERLNGEIDSRLSGKIFLSLELDAGKYDKSQEATILEAQQCSVSAWVESNRLKEVFGILLNRIIIC
jgi:hypothetical protein